MAKVKQQLSAKQEYQRLSTARARAIRNGQSTAKLDKKIERVKALMESSVMKASSNSTSASKFTNYTGVNKIPMQGGMFTPK